MLRRREPEGRGRAEPAGALPAGMNVYILSKILSAVGGRPCSAPGAGPPAAGQTPALASGARSAFALDPEVRFSERLRAREVHPKDIRRAQDAECDGGLRGAAAVVRRHPDMQRTGRLVASLLEDFLDHQGGLEASIIGAISRPAHAGDPAEMGPSEEELTPARLALADLVGAEDIQSVSTASCSTQLRGNLFKALAESMNDPGARVLSWLWRGAPAGFDEDPDVGGVFPVSDNPFKFPSDNLVAEASEQPTGERFAGYPDMDNDDAAVDEIKGYVKKGYLAKFDTYRELCEFVGGEPVFSKFCVLERLKAGRLKRRLILDFKRSLVTFRTKQSFRVILPRVSDLLGDAMAAAAAATRRGPQMRRRHRRRGALLRGGVGARVAAAAPVGAP